MGIQHLQNLNAKQPSANHSLLRYKNGAKKSIFFEKEHIFRVQDKKIFFICIKIFIFCCTFFVKKNVTHLNLAT